MKKTVAFINKIKICRKYTDVYEGGVHGTNSSSSSNRFIRSLRCTHVSLERNTSRRSYMDDLLSEKKRY